MTGRNRPAENSAGIQRGRPFEKGRSGNPAGKPKGARSRATMAAEKLLDGEAEVLTRAAISLALGGDTVALRLCLERVIAPRRDRPIKVALPAIETASDAAKALGTIATAVGRGELTPSEATDLATLIERFIKAIETAEIEERLAAIEAQFANGGGA